MSTLTMPTRELVGLISDVLPFASADPDDSTWHRVVLRYDGTRLHAMAGDGLRLAWMSWSRDDADQQELPMGWEPEQHLGDGTWELAILPENAKEIADKFKVGKKEGELPLKVTGSDDRVIVERDAEAGGVALRSVTLARPWDHNAPRIDEAITTAAEQTRETVGRAQVAYSGFALADFVDPKRVRQFGPVVLTFGPTSSHIRIGRWFQGAIHQAEIPRER